MAEETELKYKFEQTATTVSVWVNVAEETLAEEVDVLLHGKILKVVLRKSEEPEVVLLEVCISE